MLPPLPRAGEDALAKYRKAKTERLQHQKELDRTVDALTANVQVRRSVCFLIFSSLTHSRP